MRGIVPFCVLNTPLASDFSRKVYFTPFRRPASGSLQRQLHHETKILLILYYLGSRQPCAAIPRPGRHRAELTYHIHNSPERADRARARHPSPAWHLPCICRHASVGVKRKTFCTKERKRYERAAGALLLHRAGTQWVPVSAPGVQERCPCGRTVP